MSPKFVWQPESMVEMPEPTPRNLVLRLTVGVVSVYCIAGAFYFGAESQWKRAALLLIGGIFGVNWIFPRNQAEREQIHLPSDDRLAELQRISKQDAARQKCPCCGFPTLSESSGCVLCEWDSEEIALSTAQRNFAEYGWAYASEQRPVWMPAPRSEEEQELARDLIAAFSAHGRADRKHRYARWLDVLAREEDLRRAQMKRVLG